MSGGRSGITKRSHKKSKYGCSNCKTRRVKCDEGFPVCKNCNRRGEDCSYSNIRPPKSPVSESTSSDSISELLTVRKQNQSTPLTPENGELDSRFFDGLEIDPLLAGYSQDNGSLVQTKINTSNLQLSANNGFLLYPSYLSHTYMNNKAMFYFTSFVQEKMFSAKTKVRQFKEIPNYLFRYVHVHHISLSIAFLSMYYDTFDPESPNINYLEFKDLDDYLVISKMNFDLYESEKKLGNPVWQTPKHQYVSEFATAIMEILYMMLSPSATVSDPLFVWKCMLLEEHITKQFPLIIDFLSPTVDVNITYYSATHAPKIEYDQSLYFPEYLFQLCGEAVDSHYVVASAQDFVNPVSIQFLESNQSLPSSFSTEHVCPAVDFKASISDSHALRLAVETLKKEFNRAYDLNDVEKDCFRIFLRWPMSLTPEFALLLSKQDGRALVIMAHYTMFISSLPYNKLFHRKACVNELINILSIIEDDYRSWLDIPMRVLGLLGNEQ